MAYGFTYRGIHSGAYGVHYIPDAADRGALSAAFEVNSEEVSGRDGGYWYGTRAETREMTLPCYFEDITQAQLWGIEQWLGKDTSGALVFDGAPFVSYEVRPGARPEMEWYHSKDCMGQERYSGKITVFFVCYDPYGEMTLTSASGAIGESEGARTGIIHTEEMPYQPGANILGDSQLIYNPGTQRTPARVYFYGTAGEGITITNLQNGDVLKIIRATPETIGEAELVYDGEYGSVRKYYGGKDHEFAYLYHDEGYITLEPGKITRNVLITGEKGERTVHSNGMFTKEMEGQYVYINGGYRLIGEVSDSGTAALNAPLAEKASETTHIVTLNHLSIQKGAGASVEKLRVEYRPRVI